MSPLITITPLRLENNQGGVNNKQARDRMFDRVKIEQKGEYLDVIPCCLENCKEKISKKGNLYYTGYLKGLYISCRTGGVTINGSLPKFKYGENITELDIIATGEVIEEISDLLHTDISSGDITQLEFGTNVFTNYPPQEYIKRLGNKPHYKRVFMCDKDTITYKNLDDQRGRELTFYDKALETLRDNKVPDKYKGLNILRCEMRFNGLLRKQLHTGTAVTPELLTNSKFFASMKDRLKQEYNTIDKIGYEVDEILSNVKTPAEGEDAVFKGLISCVGVDEFNNIVKRVETIGRLDKKGLERFRAKMRKHITDNGGSNDLYIQELDCKINSL